MNARTKRVLLMISAFIAGAGLAYKAKPDPSAWLDWLMAGAMSVGIWIQAYWTTNPDLQPKTSAQLLESVKASDMSPAAKAAVAPALAQESAKPGAMGLPLTEQQVTARTLYQAQKADLEAIEVQRLARARLTPPAQAETDIDTLLANIETARSALASRRAQLDAQEARLTTGLAPRPLEVVVQLDGNVIGRAETAKPEQEAKP